MVKHQLNEPQTEEATQQERDIALLTNLARFFGQRSKNNLISTWEKDGLVVFVDDDNRDTMAVFEGKVVCSLVNPPILNKGSWWKIVEEIHQQILSVQVQAAVKSVR